MLSIFITPCINELLLNACFHSPALGPEQIQTASSGSADSFRFPSSPCKSKLLLILVTVSLAYSLLWLYFPHPTLIFVHLSFALGYLFLSSPLQGHGVGPWCKSGSLAAPGSLRNAAGRARESAGVLGLREMVEKLLQGRTRQPRCGLLLHS